MRIPLHHSLRRAMQVLHLISISKALKDAVWASTFDNGREQGLTIRVWPEGSGLDGGGAVFVAECRNSDQTVVYVQLGTGFENKPTDESWQHATYFAPGKERQAAAFISRAIRQLAKRGPNA